MVKAKETTTTTTSHNEKKIMVGFIWNYADFKLLIYSLFLIFFLSSFLHFLPPHFFFFTYTTTTTTSFTNLSTTTTTTTSSPETPPSSSSDFSIKRTFNPVGSAAYLFIQMGAYRGGPNTFAVVGLASKPLHVYSNAQFSCQWIPHKNSSAAAVDAVSYKMLPDWGYGRVYTVVVVNCTFADAVNADNSGGQLVVTATSGSGGTEEEEINKEMFVSLDEPAGSVDLGVFNSTPKYDYMYCGSPLYGGLSPQRVREWLAYHVKLFGSRSHFVIYDAGGVHEEVMQVLRPWIEKGVVSVQDVRDQERFDGYYHNQFLVVNDCLHRYRFDARWMFFFDVDEFMYVEGRNNKLDRYMNSMDGFTQFTIEQMPMSSKLCLSEDAGNTNR